VDANQPVSTHRPRVLVIDDEELIVQFVARVLERECDVVTAETGQAALDRIAAGEGFDVVFCDLLLPDMTGRDVYAAMLAAAPALAARTIVMTGGVFDPDLASFVESVPTPPLRKPLDVRRIRAAVTERLSATQTPSSG
jgi:CheY-like chemotaxis protein